MKISLYLSTAIISTITLGGNVWAQCVSSQDCTVLGYTESSCPNGNGVKCPFGDKWFCGADSATICKQEGFTNSCTGAGQLGKGESCANLYKQCDCQDTYKYTCTGTGYAGGSSAACDGKYTKCKCQSGYTWSNGKCTKQSSSSGSSSGCASEQVGLRHITIDECTLGWEECHYRLRGLSSSSGSSSSGGWSGGNSGWSSGSSSSSSSGGWSGGNSGWSSGSSSSSSSGGWSTVCEYEKYPYSCTITETYSICN